MAESPSVVRPLTRGVTLRVVFTVREAFGLSAGALVLWVGYYGVFFTGRRYPWWVAPGGQGANGREVAALNLTAIGAALTAGAGAGAGWLCSALSGWPLNSAGVLGTALVVGLVALAWFATRARRLWVSHAVRIDSARQRRHAGTQDR